MAVGRRWTLRRRGVSYLFTSNLVPFERAHLQFPAATRVGEITAKKDQLLWLRPPPVGSLLSRLWFPVALVVLLLLALPGLILLVLHLCGMAGEVNAWTKRELDLSYHCRFPRRCGRIPSRGWPRCRPCCWCSPIGVLYPISSSSSTGPSGAQHFPLEKRASKSTRQRALSMAAAECNLAVAVVGIADPDLCRAGPALHGQVATGKHYILMIDNSASMATTDMKPSRLEWAKERRSTSLMPRKKPSSRDGDCLQLHGDDAAKLHDRQERTTPGSQQYPADQPPDAH